MDETWLILKTSIFLIFDLFCDPLKNLSPKNTFNDFSRFLLRRGNFFSHKSATNGSLNVTIGYDWKILNAICTFQLEMVVKKEEKLLQYLSLIELRSVIYFNAITKRDRMFRQRNAFLLKKKQQLQN